MIKEAASILLLLTIMTASQAQNEGLKLVWSDEFNYKGLPDSSKWAYDIGDDGWGNNEKQNYTYRNLKNARVNGKYLIIEAGKAAGKYTSARLITKGKAFWQYGKIEVKAKIPYGRGSWPAIWMLAENMRQWPDDGEIDIMEHVGFDPGCIHGSVHTKKYNHIKQTQKTDTIHVADVAAAFHLYTLRWDKEKIILSIDNRPYFQYANEHTGYDAWPFDNPMYLILNIAVGGNWGGKKGIDDKSFPWRMLIDYVRVYQ